MIKEKRTKSRLRHLPIISVVVNLVLILIALSQVEYQGGQLHAIYQPLIVQILAIANLPAMFLSGMLVIPVALNILGRPADETTLWIQVALFMICAALQWALIGWALRRIFTSKVGQTGTNIETKS